MQSSIKRSYKESGKRPKIRLSITTPILQKLKLHWLAKSSDQDIIMLRAAATLCFYGFFRVGEITVPSLTTFNDKCHLSWGNVTIDSQDSPQLLFIHLKTSKMDQFGKGVYVISRTNTSVCAVTAVLTYMASRVTLFFIYKNSHPLTKSKFNYEIKKSCKKLGYLMRVFQDIASDLEQLPLQQ